MDKFSRWLYYVSLNIDFLDYHIYNTLYLLEHE